MQRGSKMYPLKGVIQHYSWGGYQFIPELLGIENKKEEHYAEYWLGAHPNHPSRIKVGEALNEFISTDKLNVLGQNVSDRFPSLPYLFKVLDVMKMLSIQVHPDINSAKIGYQEENKKGIPVNAPNRNYKDENHKPELMVALSDFYLLHGFKPAEHLVSILEKVPEFVFLKTIFGKENYKGLYETVMKMDQQNVNDVLAPLIQRLVPEYQASKLQKDQEDFWAARAAVSFCKDNYYDRGIFSIYFFNLLHLKKGEGIFQNAGMPHAYLEGQNLEVMANSDNVLRAGLTDKHIDVPELMKHVLFQATSPNIIRFKNNDPHKVFESPAEEFEIHQYSLNKGQVQDIDTATGEIFLLMEGQVTLNDGEKDLPLGKGESVFVTSGSHISVSCLIQAELFRVTVPLKVNN